LYCREHASGADDALRGGSAGDDPIKESDEVTLTSMTHGPRAAWKDAGLGTGPAEDPDTGAEPLLRTLAPQVLGAVIRRFGDFASAEDAVQEALIAAAAQWPEQGVPEHPKAWLIQVASRRMTDYVRREGGRHRRETVVSEERQRPLAPAPDRDAASPDDDTLVLLFVCAHPALSEHAAIALTLRAVGGLTTTEIASAFLVPASTMAARISRAKQVIGKAGVPFSLPGEAERAERLTAVLHVLYLIFSEGYVSGAGPMLTQADLATEAIRLTRTVQQQLPADPEVAGLLALMLLTDARRDARTGEHGELIPVAEQDRTRWQQPAIAEGTALLEAARAGGSVGPYQLQAAIAALHDEAARAEDTDWPRILALYGQLEQLTPNPMITLNRAVAAAMVDGPAAGHAIVDPLDTDARLGGHYRLDAVRGHLFEMAGDLARAHGHYLAAASKTASIPERSYLTLKAASVAERLAAR
jgi:RNA polymerase sigma factor (sigma-70 family)